MRDNCDENLAICLTPPGAAALAVVRMHGPRVGPFLARHFSRVPAPLRCVHGELLDESANVIDDPVVVLGEDRSSAELCVHGGAWVVQATLELLRRSGFRLSSSATPEALFPEISNPIERQVLAVLPLATTDLGVRALFAQIEAWRTFAPTPQQIDEMSRDRALLHLLHPPAVAIVGPANAGKSTLANRLLAQDRSIVADLAGTTRDWVGERADLDGLPVLLIDTPGIRQSEDPIERDAIARSGQRIATADLVVLVLDASRALEPEQSALLKQFPSSIRVINKCDCPPAFDLDSIGGIRCIASRGDGIEKVVESILRAFGVWQMDLTAPRLIPSPGTSERGACPEIVEESG